MAAEHPRTRTFQVYAWGVLLYHMAVILWGAFVRATGSGAGCGAHWPLCNGVAIPHSPTVAAVIEFSHRITSGLALTLALGLVVFAFLRFPARHLVRRAVVAAIVFEFLEALIGAALVLLGQVARDTSIGRGYTLSVHLINTLLLIGALTLVAWGAGRGATRARSGVPGFALAFGIAAAALLLLGVSGAIAALGDTLFKVSSLSAGWAQDVAVGAHPFVRLRILHPVLAPMVAFGLAALSYFVIVRRISVLATRAAYGLAGLLALQMMVGLLNLALLAPIPLQLIHLLLADLNWTVLIVLGAEVLLDAGPAASVHAAVQEHETLATL